MKFTTDRESLLKPLQQVIGVVERRQTLPVLGNLLVVANKNGLEITATDLEVEIQASSTFDIEEDGEITLPWWLRITGKLLIVILLLAVFRPF